MRASRCGCGRRPAPSWVITRSPTESARSLVATRTRSADGAADASPRSSSRPASRSPKVRCGAPTARSSSRASPRARCSACGPTRTAPRCAPTTRGGANGAALAADGSILVTQNGGIDFSQLPGVFGDLPDAGPGRRPGCNSPRPTARSSYLADDGLLGPNDLAVAADGDVYFTDPGHFPPPETSSSAGSWSTDATDRCARSPTASTTATASRSSPTARVVVVERRGLQRVHADGSREWVIEKLGAGRRRRLLPRRRRPLLRRVDDRARHPRRRSRRHRSSTSCRSRARASRTNCCFGGADLRTLFVADAIPGDLVAFEGCPRPASPSRPGPAA